MISDRDCNLSFLQIFDLMGTKLVLPFPKTNPRNLFCGLINFPLLASLVVSQIITLSNGQPILA